MAGDEERAFAGHRPVGRPFGADLAVGDKALGVADLVGRRLPDDEMGVERGQAILGRFVEIAQLLLVLPARLAFVERDQHRHVRVERFRHQDLVQLVVVIAEHVQVKRNPRPRQDVFEDFMDIVAADVKQMEIGARIVRVALFQREFR
jgi:hypothetical protein